MRLINADALKEKISFRQWDVDDDLPRDEASTRISECYVIDRMVDDMPTVDAVPVRHGKWIIRDNPGTGWYRVTCSECGEDVTSEAPCIGFFPNAKVMWDYCPYCGARTDEE